MKPCDHNIARTLLLTRQMMRLADKGDGDREDTGCGILYGVLRDSAYKIQKLAEEEKQRHIAKGWWTQQAAGPADGAAMLCSKPEKTTREEKEDES